MTAVVALPGTFCPPAVFDRLSAELGPGNRFEAWSWLTRPGPWDIPAMAADVVHHLEATSTGPVLLIGHSTGGAIALQLTLTRPDLVGALVLADTGAHMKDHGDVASILRCLRAGADPDLVAAVLDRSFHSPLEPRLREEWLAWAVRVPPQAAHDALASQHDLDFRPLLPGITAPTLIPARRVRPGPAGPACRRAGGGDPGGAARTATHRSHAGPRGAGIGGEAAQDHGLCLKPLSRSDQKG